MDDLFEPESCLTKVSTKGIQHIAHITKYLSTLTHPIDVIEELIAVISVTSNLLTTLDSTVTRFQSTITLRASFIKLLCHDISTGFTMLAQKVSEAQRLGVFEINNVGLVRVPRNAWAYVMGGELRMAQFRSRLYVEKYRVRVLIDAVAWQGLGAIGPLDRTAPEERELNNLTKMLPLVAERLMGVWKDYKPRIENGGRKVEKPVHNIPVPVKEEQKSTMVVEVQEKKEDTQKSANCSTRKLGFHSSSSTTSIASDCSSSSSVTVMDDSIFEQWVLRENESKKILTSKSYILGLPIKSTYNHTPCYHYVKPLSSHASEIKSLLSIQHLNSPPVTKSILSLPSSAQVEIQKLIENRENASSNDTVKRSFEIVAIQSQLRSCVSRVARTQSKKWWEKSGKSGPVEWVIVLQGTTVDQKARTTPSKHEDPWNPKPVVVEAPKPVVATMLQQQQQQQMQMQMQMHALQMAAREKQAVGAHVLRHVEQRRGFTPEEAELKMVEMLGDLFETEKERSVTRDNKEV